MFAFGKNKQLLSKLENYLEIAEKSVDFFCESIEYLIKNKLDDHFETIAKKVHKCESNADDMRRSIELEMYTKSLLPETREDLLEIIERLDRVPNMSETIVNTIITQKMEIADPIRDRVIELLNISKETFSYTLQATRDCFGKMEKIEEYNQLVDNNESLGDDLEMAMISKIFDTDMSIGEKILQKDMVLQLGSICDLCEHVLDKIVITTIKRHF